MTTRTTIEWTEQSWNPCTGCTKVSPGCQNCFADRMAALKTADAPVRFLCVEPLLEDLSDLDFAGIQ